MPTHEETARNIYNRLQAAKAELAEIYAAAADIVSEKPGDINLQGEIGNALWEVCEEIETIDFDNASDALRPYA